MKRSLSILCFIAIVLAAFFAFTDKGRVIIISKGSILLTNLQVAGAPPAQEKGTFRGEPCQGALNRPVGVMIAGDPEARPLSGLSFADMVVEMPVTPDGITRSLAIFQCMQPEAIGSVRSARGPFLGVAKGYDLIFGHWGGERDSLARLRKGLLDNIDAIPNPFDAFYRKRVIPMPHDGFTSFKGLYEAAKKLRYPVAGEAKFLFSFEAKKLQDATAPEDIDVPYIGPFHVTYHYETLLASYVRSRNGAPQIDSLTKKQIQAKNVLVLLAKIRPTYSQYVDVALDQSRGKMLAFRNGQVEQGFWEKKGFSEPLLFYTSRGEALALQPGATWVEVIADEPGTT